jgi:hypothetical protein
LTTSKMNMIKIKWRHGKFYLFFVNILAKE